MCDRPQPARPRWCAAASGRRADNNRLELTTGSKVDIFAAPKSPAENVDGEYWTFAKTRWAMGEKLVVSRLLEIRDWVRGESSAQTPNSSAGCAIAKPDWNNGLGTHELNHVHFCSHLVTCQTHSAFLILEDLLLLLQKNFHVDLASGQCWFPLTIDPSDRHGGSFREEQPQFSNTIMLTESFVAATLAVNKAVAHASAALKDVGIFLHEFQPQSTVRHGYKKSSSQPGCVAVGESHIFAAQADRAVVNVYSRERGNQEATVPFPERIHSVAFADEAGILVLGSEEGRLILWEVATGRVINSAASHLNAVSCLCITPGNEYIISGSADSSIHVWSLLNLVSFSRASNDSMAADEPFHSSSPDNTFSNHRTGISAITCGHATKSDTNFAVSASGDGTCYIWHVESCQLLRTLLLPNPVTSITLDPADRVMYFGCKDGRIHSWDLFQPAAKDRVLLSGATDFAPVQLQAQDAWAAPTSETGPANCLTLSYDGMSLLSGHSNGAVIRWDVAKHRILNEIASLGQPVTNIAMLKPGNFPNRKGPRYALPNIVKPNLEFSASTNTGTCGVPANYNLHVMITNSESKEVDSTDDFDTALSSGGFPQNMLDKALRSLAGGSTGVSLANGADGNNTLKVGRLEDKIVSLKEQIAALHRVEEKRRQRRLARIKVQDEMDLEKRQAYFEAQKKGQDGDEAMKIWDERKKKALADLESDEDSSDDKMDVG